MKKITIFCSFVLVSLIAFSQQKTNNLLLPPAFNAIRIEDLQNNLYSLAADAFRGRRAGTLDELEAAAWVAQKAQEAGLAPGGDNGTYFQFFNLLRARIADESRFVLNGVPLTLWKDYWPTVVADIHLSGNIVWLNTYADTVQSIKDKMVAMQIVAPNPLPAKGMSLWAFRYTLLALRNAGSIMQRNGASGLLVVADSTVMSLLPFISHAYQTGQYQIEGMQQANTDRKPFQIILISPTKAHELLVANAKVNIHFIAEHFTYPSVNVIGKIKGTDPVLNQQYVLFSSHHDHDGVGNPVDNDSIWNGADDNASVTVAMLAIARAWHEKPGKRSALFVWHGAEERGLLGSRWYAKHSTVPKNDIVAVLNGDMIGRNAPDSAALLGTLKPHKNSTALVDIAMQANDKYTHFKVDFSWDAPTHPENWYFRSDHLPYAQEGIPAIFFTTLLHPDYHTPKDEPNRIDYNKLYKMTKWMYATGWIVAESTQKPALDK
ncbi:MAG: M28 family peptidase [Hydrotalea flava]|uniref:M28 family metallopeptidase n=1 Tax=Hydrotalea TaxID=1004300 RepID=UPI00102857E4|nr:MULTISPECIES: M28 family peptidase [Hydrotalea]NIM35687.1 M28 family peptidase [Hydrotalea flava]NIM38546.1 M28 family peptidase [Hydrotalea flava]NIN03723.1 M28 family peptidase [Hydrotalea flava]NIN15424.1 M28 family peptidase [Hydrotalea flava]NIO94472.1 M28 family peptidase [Hydrotalea flava]